MAFPVKNYSSVSAAAPVLTGVAQSLQQLIRACLVTGYGSKAVQSLTVSAGIATAVYATAHAYEVGKVLRVTGAGASTVNGERLVLSVTASAVTFAAPGTPDGVVSGSISTDIAPAGWTEVYTTGSVSVFKPSAVEATGLFLRVDDAGALNARIRLYETMSDASTGTGPTPLDSQVSGGLYWPKSGTANATARPWVLIADDRGFYFAADPQSTGRYTLVFGGDFASFKSGDAWAAMVAGNQSDQTNLTTTPDGCCGFSNRDTRSGAYIARAHSATGGSVAANRMGAAHNGTASAVYSGGPGYSGAAYPNQPNNGLLLTKPELWSLGLRGTLPGLYHIRNSVGQDVGVGITIDGTDDLAGRKLLLLRVAPPTGAVAPGVVALDLTGPWVR